MSQKTVFDTTDKGTLRPNEPPLPASGKAFQPMDLPFFDYKIHLPDDVSPDNPITLFTMYYTPEMINLIVLHTNNHIRKPGVPASELPRRIQEWHPTCAGEIYTYLAIRVYMTIHIENEISDYWSVKEMTPKHPIISHMSRDCFQELHMKFRLAGSQASGPYARVSFIKET